MRIWKKAAAIALVGTVLPTLAISQEKPPQPEGASLRVARDVLTTGVVERVPIDEATVFPASVGVIYYFTEVQGAHTPTRITHIWYYETQTMAEIPLSVESPRWRTWSSKRILEKWIGRWKVEAVGPDGTLLSSRTFDVH